MLAALLAACAQGPRIDEPSAPLPSIEPKRTVAPVPQFDPLALERYKASVAREIWLGNAAVYSDPIPEMLKSIVVLAITIDRAGNPVDVYVYRSNGFRHLESLALESIVRAAPFPAPPAAVLQGVGEVTFLETFLFRDDDYFQLRTLVSAAAR